MGLIPIHVRDFSLPLGDPHKVVPDAVDQQGSSSTLHFHSSVRPHLISVSFYVYILGFHMTSEKTKIKHVEFLPSSCKRHFKDIPAGLFSAR